MAEQKKQGGARKSRSAQGGLAQTVKPDAQLAAIVGSEPLTRDRKSVV